MAITNDTNGYLMEQPPPCPTGYPYTMACWVNVSSISKWETQVAMMFDNFTGGGGGPMLGVYNPDGVLSSYRVIFDGKNGFISSSVRPSVGSWAHICAANLEHDSKLYVNGSLATTGSYSNWVHGTNGSLHYMSRPNYGSRDKILKGSIAEAAVWDVQLTADEVLSLGKGINPKRVRPQSLKLYRPYIRAFSAVNSDVSVSGTSPAVTPHPRIYP